MNVSNLMEKQFWTNYGEFKRNLIEVCRLLYLSSFTIPIARQMLRRNL